MNGKSAMMLLLAVFSGLGAMYGTSKMLSKEGAPVEKQSMVVAARDLKVDEVLREDVIKTIQVPKEDVAAGSFRSAKDVLERCVQIPTLAGEPIVDAKLAPKGTAAGLVSRIPNGMRAFAIEINEHTGVSGFVLPGHRVDVVQSKGESGTIGTGLANAELILQNVLVLASGQIFTRPDDKSLLSRTVTLAVTPPQVDLLVSARSRGPLSLSLRGVNDHDLVERPEPPAPEPPPVPNPPVAAVQPVELPAPIILPLPAPKTPRRHLTIVHGLHRIDRHMLGETDSQEDQ